MNWLEYVQRLIVERLSKQLPVDSIDGVKIQRISHWLYQVDGDIRAMYIQNWGHHRNCE